MIIVEGPDGSGKSTLIEQLGYVPRKFRALRAGEGGTAADGACERTASGWGSTDEAPVAYARALLQALTEPKRIALDRFHLSEMVYGPMLRGRSGITTSEAVLLRRLTRARGIPIYLCLPPFAETLANVCRPGREQPTFQTADFLRAAYERWESFKTDPSMLGRDLIVRDYTEDPPIYAAPALPTCPVGVIGSPAARFLFVGERPNVDLGLPFYSLMGSAGYLNSALADADFEEDEIAFTNALNMDGNPNPLVNIICGMPRGGTVIPLGRIAAEGVREAAATAQLDVWVRPLPHPQYWKRFHASERTTYVQRLREIRAAG